MTASIFVSNWHWTCKGYVTLVLCQLQYSLPFLSSQLYEFHSRRYPIQVRTHEIAYCKRIYSYLEIHYRRPYSLNYEPQKMGKKGKSTETLFLCNMHSIYLQWYTLHTWWYTVSHVTTNMQQYLRSYAFVSEGNTHIRHWLRKIYPRLACRLSSIIHLY